MKKLSMLTVMLLAGMLIISGCSASPSDTLVIEGPGGPNAGKEMPSKMKVETLELNKTYVANGVAEYTFTDFKISETNCEGQSNKGVVYFQLTVIVKNLGDTIEINKLMIGEVAVSRNQKFLSRMFRKIDGEFKPATTIEPGDEAEILIQVGMSPYNPNNQVPVDLSIFSYLEAEGVEYTHKVK